jgi:hypothetical protein
MVVESDSEEEGDPQDEQEVASDGEEEEQEEFRGRVINGRGPNSNHTTLHHTKSQSTVFASFLNFFLTFQCNKSSSTFWCNFYSIKVKFRFI